MVAGSEDRVQAHGGGEIGLGAPDISQVVLGDSPVEEGPVVRGIQLGQDVEIGHGFAQASVLQGGAAPEGEDVFVVLGTGRHRKQQR